MNLTKPLAVLLSGGLDSTVALHWACQRVGADRVVAISFDYGANHGEQELACASYQAALLGVLHRVLNLRSVSEHLHSALLQGAEAVPVGEYQDSTMRATVVPFRNGIFLSIAAGVAESAGCGSLVIAAHGGDHAVYPDCRESFLSAMSQAVELGTYAQLQIVRPFVDWSKDEIVRLGVQLGVNFDRTYSCYCGGERPCGECATCNERQQALSQVLQESTV